MIQINLLPQELRIVAKKKGADFALLLRIMPAVFAALIVLHLLLAMIAAAKSYQLYRLNRKWQRLEPQRRTLDNFKRQSILLSEDARITQGLTAERINWAEKLNKLSLNLPSGVWFQEISASKNNFVLFASAVSLQKQEMGLINKFIEGLKSDPGFFKDFENLELGPIETEVIGGYDIANFSLRGSLKKR